MKQLRILLLVLLTSCATQKNAEKYYALHKGELASTCLENFPIDTITITRTDTLHEAKNEDYSGKIDTLLKTVYVPVEVTDNNCIEEYNKAIKAGAVLRQQVTALRASYKPCKPDTLVQTVTRTIEDSRKLFIANEAVAVEKKAHDKDVFWKHVFMWWAIIATAIVAAGVVLAVVKKIV